jgi:hypothetical protein
MLSGPRQGNYHEVVDRLAMRATEEGGELANVATSGSVSNIKRLSDGCTAKFALVQDGIPAPKGAELSLIGRLRKSESMFFIGRKGDEIRKFSQLEGLRIGLGPAGSGTDFLARKILEAPDFRRLNMKLANFKVRTQLDMLQRGDLDLGVFVVDEDAALISAAVRDRGLQVVSFDNADAVARHYSFLDTGRIAAGQFDAIKMLPAQDKRVFRVGTLVLTNGCTDHAERIALLSLLVQEFPDFIQFNRDHGYSDDFRLSSSAARFLEQGGMGFADRHVPWLVQIMPPSNWVYVIMVISVFINLTTTWHRFRLWRLDANTDKADVLVREVIGEHKTPAEMMALEPTPEHATKDNLERLDEALTALDELRLRCRRQANSLLVPMGQEWIYRYTEQQMEETLTAMRRFRDQAAKLADASATTDAATLAEADTGDADDADDADDAGTDSEDSGSDSAPDSV